MFKLTVASRCWNWRVAISIMRHGDYTDDELSDYTMDNPLMRNEGELMVITERIFWTLRVISKTNVCLIDDRKYFSFFFLWIFDVAFLRTTILFLFHFPFYATIFFEFPVIIELEQVVK